jgi:hypothetical protein
MTSEPIPLHNRVFHMGGTPIDVSGNISSNPWQLTVILVLSANGFICQLGNQNIDDGPPPVFRLPSRRVTPHFVWLDMAGVFAPDEN